MRVKALPITPTLANNAGNIFFQVMPEPSSTLAQRPALLPCVRVSRRMSHIGPKVDSVAATKLSRLRPDKLTQLGLPDVADGPPADLSKKRCKCPIVQPKRPNRAIPLKALWVIRENVSAKVERSGPIDRVSSTPADLSISGRPGRPWCDDFPDYSELH
jgi:hypothetical protein